MRRFLDYFLCCNRYDDDKRDPSVVDPVELNNIISENKQDDSVSSILDVPTIDYYALMIQKLVRGYLGRIKSLKRRHELLLEAKLFWKNVARQVELEIKEQEQRERNNILAIVRDFSINFVKSSINDALRNISEEYATITIQRIWRGYSSRTRLIILPDLTNSSSTLFESDKTSTVAFANDSSYPENPKTSNRNYNTQSSNHPMEISVDERSLSQSSYHDSLSSYPFKTKKITRLPKTKGQLDILLSNRTGKVGFPIRISSRSPPNKLKLKSAYLAPIINLQPIEKETIDVTRDEYLMSLGWNPNKDYYLHPKDNIDDKFISTINKTDPMLSNDMKQSLNLPTIENTPIDPNMGYYESQGWDTTNHLNRGAYKYPTKKEIHRILNQPNSTNIYQEKLIRQFNIRDLLFQSALLFNNSLFQLTEKNILLNRLPINRKNLETPLMQPPMRFGRGTIKRYKLNSYSKPKLSIRYKVFNRRLRSKNSESSEWGEVKMRIQMINHKAVEISHVDRVYQTQRETQEYIDQYRPKRIAEPLGMKKWPRKKQNYYKFRYAWLPQSMVRSSLIQVYGTGNNHPHDQESKQTSNKLKLTFSDEGKNNVKIMPEPLFLTSVDNLMMNEMNDDLSMSMNTMTIQTKPLSQVSSISPHSNRFQSLENNSMTDQSKVYPV